MNAELHWIDGVRQGRLAIMPRPRGGDWLADELASWRRSGVDVLVSLLRGSENEELGLDDEGSLAEGLGMSFISFPITDRGVPDSVDDLLALANRLDNELRSGRGVAIHCRMGIGRSSLLAACLLVKSGHSPAEAFDTISRARGLEVPDTRDQIDWLVSLQNELTRSGA
ncbi:MAG: dual specificity protein phosphatase family protein [Planctomycetes bacterium]|nr:dual specificity protein phosphatase family protein [Planctomycetota bacterium]